MVLVTGKHVELVMKDGTRIVPPARDGLIHDPDGETFDRCYLYIGPYRRISQKIEPTTASKDYFGPDTKTFGVEVDVPFGPWISLGDVAQLLYARPGWHKGDYHHDFRKDVRVRVTGCRDYLRLSMPTSCIVNWRGIVYP